MAISLVSGQTANAFANPVSTLNVVLPNRPQQGNLVVVGAVWGTGTITATLTDSNGNAYSFTPASPALISGGGARGANFFLKNAPANASATITITTSAATDITLHAAEFAGAEINNVVGAEAVHNDATSSGNINDPTITPSFDNSLLFCVCAANISSANSPWTGIGSIVNGNYAEYLIQSSKAAQAVSFTQPSGNWLAIATEFKAAPTPTLQPIYQPADDESGWIAEMTQIIEWWG